MARVSEVWKLNLPLNSTRPGSFCISTLGFPKCNSPLDIFPTQSILFAQGNFIKIREINMKKLFALTVLASAPILTLAQSAGTAPETSAPPSTVAPQNSSQGSTAHARRHHRRSSVRHHHKRHTTRKTPQ